MNSCSAKPVSSYHSGRGQPRRAVARYQRDRHRLPPDGQPHAHRDRGIRCRVPARSSKAGGVVACQYRTFVVLHQKSVDPAHQYQTPLWVHVSHAQRSEFASNGTRLADAPATLIQTSVFGRGDSPSRQSRSFAHDSSSGAESPSASGAGRITEQSRRESCGVFQLLRVRSGRQRVQTVQPPSSEGFGDKLSPVRDITSRIGGGGQKAGARGYRKVVQEMASWFAGR